jgi:hypothetical protein
MQTQVEAAPSKGGKKGKGKGKKTG